MARPKPPSGDGALESFERRLKYPSFATIAKTHKASFVQWFIMSGILIASLRSLGQKYCIHELSQDSVNLRQEQESLNARMTHIKESLRAEAAAEPTGAFAARLRLLFGDDN